LIVAYTARVRRIQIYLDEPLDDLLSSRSAREHRSKASLIREAVAGYYGGERAVTAESDPLDAWVGGTADQLPPDIDTVVYGPLRDQRE
jgi:hypothetical protein